MTAAPIGQQVVASRRQPVATPLSGTSMATPHVTGAAALYASTHGAATAQQIKHAILGNVIATLALSGRASESYFFGSSVFGNFAMTV
jgi:subtilisin family serine protease